MVGACSFVILIAGLYVKLNVNVVFVKKPKTLKISNLGEFELEFLKTN